MDWSREEVEAIVADYLRMLTLELTGQKYNKSEHRRALQQKLTNRSEASIEFKHSNISAVMLELGFPYLRGYKPLSNYQSLLLTIVVDQIHSDPIVDQAALSAVEQPAVVPTEHDFTKVKADAPQRELKVAESSPISFVAVKRDYLEREERNRSLGAAGEEFVIQFEQWRLYQFGQRQLAERVERVSKSKGDGLGYDVLSFDTDGRERFIEVKTTTFGRETPFFVSRRELALSTIESNRFHLYRVFDFRKAPRIFDLSGPLEQHCTLDPLTYKASFA